MVGSWSSCAGLLGGEAEACLAGRRDGFRGTEQQSPTAYGNFSKKTQLPQSMAGG